MFLGVVVSSGAVYIKNDLLNVTSVLSIPFPFFAAGFFLSSDFLLGLPGGILLTICCKVVDRVKHSLGGLPVVCNGFDLVMFHS